MEYTNYKSMDVKSSCKNCEMSYCSQCSDDTTVLSTSKTSVLEPIDYKSIRLVACNDHSEEKFKFWCHTCLKLICLNCITSQHNGHQYTEIENEMINKVKEVRIKFYLQDLRK